MLLNSTQINFLFSRSTHLSAWLMGILLSFLWGSLVVLGEARYLWGGAVKSGQRASVILASECKISIFFLALLFFILDLWMDGAKIMISNEYESMDRLSLSSAQLSFIVCFF